MNAIDVRKKSGLNQTMFWGKLGISQSAGSRYESGRNIPAPVQTLMDLVYGKRPLPILAKLRSVTLAELVK